MTIVESKDVPPEKFSGNFFTGKGGIMYFAMTGFFFCSAIYMLEQSPGPLWSWFFILIGAIFLCYIFFGADAYYFIVSEKYLFVKNHLFFWYHWHYPISDITTIVIIRPYHWRGNWISDSLLIRNSALASKTFPASNLRDKDWDALGEKMKNLGIEVVIDKGRRPGTED